ncbi:hypothetical protein Pla144_19310 [Bythopirellula polymerisocia]|uniref:Uncharacterized protein n=2 Tax=Bythopirellula polymerisocia TaxID=2528003 RepID=A0A5C6D173_9BACT|nr:hypothetical protein Pla144_19310 [Bythopirellula polymerisocia]
MVNVADPGRLIQQSYYAGKLLDRTSAGQNPNWSPWAWNPIQGGGVGSWAAASEFRREDMTLYSETTPKLWDMPDEKGQALMRQWVSHEHLIPNAVVVQCEFVSLRDKKDFWGGTITNPQEVPACYFTRNFATVKSYLGSGRCRKESHPPGPLWGKTKPPRKALACFDGVAHGIAVFSPSSTQHWNFGPHSNGLSDDPTAGPCMHVAPIDRANLALRSTYRYRYWLVVGVESLIESSLEILWARYADERVVATEP